MEIIYSEKYKKFTIIVIELFETKIINTSEFKDFLNLSLKPMFLNINEKRKSQILTLGKMNEHHLGMLFLDIPRKEFVEINSLGVLANELKKHSFIFDDKWEKE